MKKQLTIISKEIGGVVQRKIRKFEQFELAGKTFICAKTGNKRDFFTVFHKETGQPAKIILAPNCASAITEFSDYFIRNIVKNEQRFAWFKELLNTLPILN